MKPRPSHYNRAIFKKIVVFLKNVPSIFNFNWDAARKRDVFAEWKLLLKLCGSCGVRWKRAVASSLPYASQRSPPSSSGSKTSLLRESWWFFTFGRDAARETNVRLGCSGIFTKAGWKLWPFSEQAVASSSSAIWKRSRPLTLQRSPPSDLQRYNT